VNIWPPSGPTKVPAHGLVKEGENMFPALESSDDLETRETYYELSSSSTLMGVMSATPYFESSSCCGVNKSATLFFHLYIFQIFHSCMPTKLVWHSSASHCEDTYWLQIIHIFIKYWIIKLISQHLCLQSITSVLQHTKIKNNGSREHFDQYGYLWVFTV
jgi:hypothetical protein